MTGESLQQRASEYASQLASLGVAAEQLAEWRERPRWQFWARRPRLQKLGEAYRLGVLLLGADGSIWQAGGQVRAVKRERLGVVAQSQEERRDLAGIAYDSGFRAGETVNFELRQIPSTLHELQALADPTLMLGVYGEHVRVRWRVGADLATAPDFDAYCRERIALAAEAG